MEDAPTSMQVDVAAQEEAPVGGCCSLDLLPDGVAVEVLQRLPLDARGLLACCSRRWRRLTDTPALWKRISLEGMQPPVGRLMDWRAGRLQRILRHALMRAGVVHTLDLRGAPSAPYDGFSYCGNQLRLGRVVVDELLAAGAMHLTFLHTGDLVAFSPSTVSALTAARAGATADMQAGSFVTVLYNANDRARTGAHPPPGPPAGLAEPPPRPALLVPAGCEVALCPQDHYLFRLHHGHDDGRLDLLDAIHAVASSHAFVTALGTHVKEGRPVTHRWDELLSVAQDTPAVFSRLRHLDLRGLCSSSPAGIAAVAQLLASPACCTVQALNMSGCNKNITPELIAAAGGLPALTDLDLSRNIMSAACSTALGAGLATRTAGVGALRLDLGHCELRDSGLAKIMGAALGAGCALSSLILSSNVLTDEGAISLCDSLRAPPSSQPCSLSRLVLSSNAIRPAGAFALANTIKAGVLPQLTYLDVSDNLLKETGGAALASCLSSPMCKLQVLDAASCRLGNDGLVAFAEALRNNTVLRVLHVADAGASDAGILALADGLEACTLVGNKTLEVLHVGTVNAQCSDDAIERIKAAGRHLSTCWIHRPKSQPPSPAPISGDAEAGPSPAA